MTPISVYWLLATISRCSIMLSGNRTQKQPPLDPGGQAHEYSRSMAVDGNE